MVRRVVSVTAIVVALPIWVVTAPLWVPVTVLVDLAGGLWRLPTLRLAVGAGVYLAHDWIGVAAATGLWSTGRFGRRLDLDAHRALQGWWANSLLTWTGRLFGVRIDPIDHRTLPSSTFIVLSRHASMADALLPAAVVAGPMGRFVHYVLKRELRWDPSLDIVGTRLGNHFVARGGDTDAEAEAIERLAAEARPGAVLVIFPEGTYSTPQRRQRVIDSLRGRGDDEAVVRAERLRHLLPPKPAGTLALLRGQPEADVVIIGHTGLEGVAELAGLRRRLPLDHPVRTTAWTYPRSELPESEEKLIAWLRDRWDELDRWVDDARHPRPDPS